MSITRREFLAGSAAAATAAVLPGCSKREDAPLLTLRGVAEEKGMQFIGTDGQPVNLGALQTSFNGNYSTMSFMFAACGDTCPLTATALAQLSQKQPNLKHIVVSVDPLGDFTDQHLDGVLNAEGLRTRGPNANTVILYPTRDGTAKQASLLTSGAAELENAFNLVTMGKQASGHSGAVTLFNPNGAVITQATNGPASIAKLAEHLPQGLQR